MLVACGLDDDNDDDDDDGDAKDEWAMDVSLLHYL